MFIFTGYGMYNDTSIYLYLQGMVDIKHDILFINIFIKDIVHLYITYGSSWLNCLTKKKLQNPFIAVLTSFPVTQETHKPSGTLDIKGKNPEHNHHFWKLNGIYFFVPRVLQ